MNYKFLNAFRLIAICLISLISIFISESYAEGEIKYRITPIGRCAKLMRKQVVSSGRGQQEFSKLLWKKDGDEYVPLEFRKCTFEITNTAGGDFFIKTSTFESFVGDVFEGDRRFHKRKVSKDGKLILTMPVLFEGCSMSYIDIFPRTCKGQNCPDDNLLGTILVGLDNQRCDV